MTYAGCFWSELIGGRRPAQHLPHFVNYVSGSNKDGFTGSRGLDVGDAPVDGAAEQDQQVGTLQHIIAQIMSLPVFQPI